MSGKARARFAAVGLVLLGFALGVLADHLWLAHRLHSSSDELTHGESLVAMLETLDLTDAQRETIDAILERYHNRIKQQLADIHPVLLSTIDSARHEVEAILEPDQLETFHAWLREEHQRFRPVRFPVDRH